ncbi:Adhesion G protein-coupled receptor A3, partial [Plecturocebus cupreus]
MDCSDFPECQTSSKRRLSPVYSAPRAAKPRRRQKSRASRKGHAGDPWGSSTGNVLVRGQQKFISPPLELLSFYMTLSHRQVVFEGYSLPFQCMASYIDQDMQVLWYQDGRIVETDESQGIFVEKNMIHKFSLIPSALTISNIQAGSTGNWGCHVQTKRENNTRTVDIVVLREFCTVLPSRERGQQQRWPRTLAGITAYLQCTRNTHDSGIYPGSPRDERKAWCRCDRGGFWEDDDYSRFQYANDITRVLYMFNQMPLNLTNAVATARQLLAYTVEAANFSDKMVVIFVAETIKKFGRFMKEEKSKEVWAPNSSSAPDNSWLKPLISSKMVLSYA